MQKSREWHCPASYPDYKMTWSRFPFYRDWLANCPSCTDGVMLTDVRDVFFQSGIWRLNHLNCLQSFVGLILSLDFSSFDLRPFFSCSQTQTTGTSHALWRTSSYEEYSLAYKHSYFILSKVQSRGYPGFVQWICYGFKRRNSRLYFRDGGKTMSQLVPWFCWTPSTFFFLKLRLAGRIWLLEDKKWMSLEHARRCEC